MSLLFVVAAGLGAYVILIGLVSAVDPLRRVGSSLLDEFAQPLAALFNNLHRNRRFDRIEREVRRALGEEDQWGERERADVVAAAIAAQRIDVLNQTLRTSAQKCLGTHLAVAEGLGAVHMSESARHPLCRHLRQRVIDVSDLLSHTLASYPLLLESPDLIKLQLGLRWIPASCARCPYWTCSRADAPRRCGTVSALCGDSTSRDGGSIVDGMVIEDATE